MVSGSGTLTESVTTFPGWILQMERSTLFSNAGGILNTNSFVCTKRLYFYIDIFALINIDEVLLQQILNFSFLTKIQH